MQQITIHAHAKINLALDVIRRRPDGYHDVRMVMQSLFLHDTLTIRKTEQPGIILTARNAELHPDITWDEHNLVYKAAKLWSDTYPHEGGLRILIDKQIPSAAGLAGGSSDAAATLKGLNRLFDKNVSVEELKQLGIRLGADVPYCIQLGTPLSEGTGEILTPLPAAPGLYCVLAKPDYDVSTKYIYEHLDLSTATHPDTDAMIRAIENSNIPAICHSLGNILEPVACGVCPEILSLEETMKKLGALGVRMSGSGPTVFGLYTDANKALEAAGYLKEHGYPHTAFVTRFYQP